MRFIARTWEIAGEQNKELLELDGSIMPLLLLCTSAMTKLLLALALPSLSAATAAAAPRETIKFDFR